MNEIPDLWGDKIGKVVLSPKMILQAQAEALTRKTGGVLRGEVRPDPGRESNDLMFDIVAPLLDNQRRYVLTLRFPAEEVYPVVITAPPLRHMKTRSHSDLYEEINISQDELEFSTFALSEEELTTILRTILQDPSLQAHIQSMLARSTEVQHTASPGNSSRDKSSP